jgi:hypothetical protein
MVCGDRPSPNLHHTRHRSHEPKMTKPISIQRRKTMQSRRPPSTESQLELNHLDVDALTIPMPKQERPSSGLNSQTSTLLDDISNVSDSTLIDETSASPSRGKKSASTFLGQLDSSTDSTYSNRIASPPSTPSYPTTSLDPPAFAYPGRSPVKEGSGTRRMYQCRNMSQGSLNFTPSRDTTTYMSQT